MEKEVMYWVCFKSENSMHDRIENFFGEDLKSFAKWVQEKRAEVEQKTGKSIVISNCGKV